MRCRRIMAALVATLGAVTHARADTPRSATMRALVCRGKAGIDLKLVRDPSPDDAKRVRMVLRYQTTTKPGLNYENLQPGQCTWNPGAYPSEPIEPGFIYFDVMRQAQPYDAPPPRQIDTTINAAVFFPDPITLPRYLGSPDHYWQFYVDDLTMISTSFGAYRATVRAPSYITEGVRGSTTSSATTVVATGPVGESTTRSQPGAGSSYTPGGVGRVSNLGRAALIFRSVSRAWKRNTLYFSARPESNPQVSWSTEPPIRNGVGQLGFRAPNAWPVRPGSSNGLAAEYGTAPSTVMPTGTKIYFVIRVPADANNREAEYSGEFTTMSQTVVVRFRRMEILNDSDKNGAGELSFSFFMALPSQEIANCMKWTECESHIRDRSWESGTSHDLANVLTMRNAPDKIRVWVHGWDNDTDIGGQNWVTQYGPMGTYWTAQPGSSSKADWNVTGREVDVSILPTQTQFTIPLTLRSRDGYVFMFSVTAEVEVTRQ